MKQINRIVLFGDSFIQGTGCFYKLESDGRMVNHPSVNEYHDMELKKFQNENSWSIHLKKYFPNVDIINYGKDGCSNYDQFVNFRNYFHETYKPTDLILFGFTSKYRDFSRQFKFMWNPNHTPLLSEDNPINNNPLAWDKLNYTITGSTFAIPGYDMSSISESERKLSNQFILDYVSHVHNDEYLNYSAKANYVFLQNFVKFNNLNFHCFDLFENYVEGRIGEYEIDTSIYLNYNSDRNDSMLDYLIDYEKNNGMPDEYSIDKPFKVSYFEDNHSYLNNNRTDILRTMHPNQFGYEKWIDYISSNILTKKYIN